jgi:DNA-directed RNA polymerase specialized sigma24 family protein
LAQGAAQEAYSRAWQRWRTVGGYDDPEVWVRTVGYRLVANRWRKARNRLIAYRRHVPAPDTAPPGEDVVALVEALRQRSAEQRLAITLHHLLDLPVAEVAREIGVSTNTVKARPARGRRVLAQLLNADLPEESFFAGDDSILVEETPNGRGLFVIVRVGNLLTEIKAAPADHSLSQTLGQRAADRLCTVVDLQPGRSSGTVKHP